MKANASPIRTAAHHRATRERCDCGGYWFPHRRTGGACCHGPRCDFYLALRAGWPRHEAEQLLSADQLERMSARGA